MFRRWSILVAACLPALGCGRKADDFGHVPVNGRVLLNGKPLIMQEGWIGKVWFYPDASESDPSSVPPFADIDDEGGYTLSTGGRAGAPPGRYRVMVIATQPSNPQRPYHRRRSLIPARYSAVETSGIVVQVVDDPKPGVYDLKLRK